MWSICWQDGPHSGQCRPTTIMISAARVMNQSMDSFFSVVYSGLVLRSRVSLARARYPGGMYLDVSLRPPRQRHPVGGSCNAISELSCSYMLASPHQFGIEPTSTSRMLEDRYVFSIYLADLCRQQLANGIARSKPESRF